MFSVSVAELYPGVSLPLSGTGTEMHLECSGSLNMSVLHVLLVFLHKVLVTSAEFSVWSQLEV